MTESSNLGFVYKVSETMHRLNPNSTQKVPSSKLSLPYGIVLSTIFHHVDVPLKGITPMACKFINTSSVELMHLNPSKSAIVSYSSSAPEPSAAPSSPPPTVPSSDPSNLLNFDLFDVFANDPVTLVNPMIPLTLLTVMSPKS